MVYDIYLQQSAAQAGSFFVLFCLFFRWDRELSKTMNSICFTSSAIQLRNARGGWQGSCSCKFTRFFPWLFLKIINLKNIEVNLSWLAFFRR
jgi:hypothetical protein